MSDVKLNTHPGSGLPTIYESGRISAHLVCDQFGVYYQPVDLASEYLRGAETVAAVCDRR